MGAPYRARLFTVDGVGAGQAGRRSRARTDTGRRVGAARPAGTGGSVHLLETVRAAAPFQVERGRRAGPLALALEDLRLAVREGHESNLVLFCVDASGSMAARRRMQAVKTAILSLLTDAYQRRDKVGLVTFRGAGAELALPPTGSVDVAVARLRELPAGGRTPLAEALARVADVIRVERVRDPRRRPLLVLVTDGRATHGRDPLGRAHAAAAALRATGLTGVVVDCETGPLRLGLAHRLADLLGATHVPIGDVDARALTATVRSGSAGTGTARAGTRGVA
jgi:magnesium chelatase subunit D